MSRSRRRRPDRHAHGGVLQLYVRDRVAGRTLLASAGATGAAADAAGRRSGRPPRLRDLRRRALRRVRVAGDEPRRGRPRRVEPRRVPQGPRDRGGRHRLPRRPSGAQANAIGRRATRTSRTTAPAWSTRRGPPRTSGLGDASPASDVVLRDLTFGTSDARERRARGGPPLGGQASISADGRHVALRSPGRSVLVRDVTGAGRPSRSRAPRPHPTCRATARPSRSSRAPESNGTPPSGPAIPVTRPPARDRRSPPTGVASPTRCPAPPAQVLAQTAGAPAERVSERADGSPSTRPSVAPGMSANGAIVAFTHDDSGGTSLVAGDVNGRADVLAATPRPDRRARAAAHVPPLQPRSPDAGAPRCGVSGTASGPVRGRGRDRRRHPGCARPSGSFSVEVPLAVGVNVIPIRATDGAGNVTELTVTTAQGLAARAEARREGPGSVAESRENRPDDGRQVPARQGGKAGHDAALAPRAAVRRASGMDPRGTGARGREDAGSAGRAAEPDAAARGRSTRCV